MPNLPADDSVQSDLVLPSVELIRTGLLQLIKTRFHGQIRYILGDTEAELNYWRDLITAYRLFEEEMVKGYPNEPTSENGQLSIFVVMSADLNRVIAPAACFAWVTTDQQRLHQLQDSQRRRFRDCPEDLSYGLVEQYCRPILRYASFIAGISRAAELDRLSEEVRAEIEEDAQSYLQALR